MASSYTTFPSQSQTYTGTATLTSIVPSKTASLALSYTPPISAGTNPATRFLSTPSIAGSSDNGAGNPDVKLALGLGLGLGLSALLALLATFFVLRHRKQERASFERRTAGLHQSQASSRRQAVVEQEEGAGRDMQQKEIA